MTVRLLLIGRRVSRAWVAALALHGGCCIALRDPDLRGRRPKVVVVELVVWSPKLNRRKRSSPTRIASTELALLNRGPRVFDMSWRRAGLGRDGG
jgi:hypothetical protein